MPPAPSRITAISSRCSQDKARLRRSRISGEDVLLAAGRPRSPGLWADANLARLRRSLDALEDGRAQCRFDDTQWQCLVTAWYQQQ